MALNFRFAKKNDLPLLEYCTLPRTGALEVILNVLGPNAKPTNNGFTSNATSNSGNITKICDVTIAYPQGKPLDLFQIVFGSRPPCITHVHYRVFDVKDVRKTGKIHVSFTNAFFADSDGSGADEALDVQLVRRERKDAGGVLQKRHFPLPNVSTCDHKQSQESRCLAASAGSRPFEISTVAPVLRSHVDPFVLWLHNTTNLNHHHQRLNIYSS